MFPVWWVAARQGRSLSADTTFRVPFSQSRIMVVPRMSFKSAKKRTSTPSVSAFPLHLTWSSRLVLFTFHKSLGVGTHHPSASTSFSNEGAGHDFELNLLLTFHLTISCMIDSIVALQPLTSDSNAINYLRVKLAAEFPRQLLPVVWPCNGHQLPMIHVMVQFFEKLI